MKKKLFLSTIATISLLVSCATEAELNSQDVDLNPSPSISESPVSSSFPSPGKEYFHYEYTHDPIYLSINDFQEKIKSEKPREIKNTGKIYIYQNYIFINEKDVGVHVIDNTDPTKPKNITFLNIPFNEDIAIKGNTMYADFLGDLVALDITDIENIKLLEKIELADNVRNYRVDSEKGIQIGYKSIKTKVDGPRVYESVNPSSLSGSSLSGRGGSLARFTIVNDLLYTVSNSELNLFDIKNSNKPNKLGAVTIDDSRRDMETIYPYKDKIFMGSQTGTYIYDNTNPTAPEFITKIEHTRSCDPVVVEGTKAYVTLKSGNSCRNGENKLDIIDFSDLENAKIIASHPMTNPSGLAIDNGTLYISDGSDGLKVFDVNDPLKINKIANINIDKPIDIILKENKKGIVISEAGLYQYDFSNLKSNQEIKEISFIKAEKTFKEDEYSSYETVETEKDTFYYKWYTENYQ